MASPSSPGDDVHSIANSSTSPPSLPAWHFPFGPSSKYHQRERRRTPAQQHSRNNSSYTPRAPALATERRSHHRRALTGGLPSPPSTSSDISASPLSRFGNGAISMAQHNLPTTPAKARRNSPVFHDSPFSDYFTDPDARSLHDHITPSTATQQLLVRMNKLQSQLIRTSTSPNQQTLHSPDEAIAIVGRHLTSLEHDLSTLSSQSRYVPELSDSGLFMHAGPHPAEEFPAATGALPSSSSSSTTSSSPAEDPSVTITHLRAERDYFLAETQRLLSGLRSAQTQLRLRHDELRELHEQQDKRVGRVEEENAGLRADLAADAGELIFLKLTSKDIEAKIAEKKDERKGLVREMEKWWVDWKEVDERFRRRRGTGESFKEGEEERVGWGLETVKTVEGRVMSVTIKRVEGGGDEEEEELGVYVDRGVQTEEDEDPAGFSAEVDVQPQDEAVVSSEQTSSATEEAAPADDGEDDEHEVKPEASVKTHRTAWQELWEGLSALAGMDESHF